MRICIFGAGAVGSHLAVRLARAGNEVSCVMRGPHLEAVRRGGLTLRVGSEEFRAKVKASDNPADLGPQDFVISTLKATGVSALAAGTKPLLMEDTAIVFAQNGIPWWYDIGLPASHPVTPDLSFLDPGGALRAAIPRERIVGGVVFSSNEVIAPGVVENLTPERNMLLIGECDDRASERVAKLRSVLNEASIDSPQQGNALQIHSTTDTNSFIRYYRDAADNNLKFMSNGSVAPVVVAKQIINPVIFKMEDSSGNVLTGKQNNCVIGLTLDFSELEGIGAPVGPGKYYQSFRITTKIAQRTL